ncbi:tenascin-like isoform X1 [Pecten maximus]|uniref:tenascin-like isoform X1 n=1 Tax=Pecten maximus TaxID=6579 RepID=UPI0014581367|nr:tenascin-like isoform X1 [Pecten maximus]
MVTTFEIIHSKTSCTFPEPLSPDSLSSYRIENGHAKLKWRAPRGQVDGYSVVLKNCMEDVVAEETTMSTHLSISLGNHRISAAYFVEIRSLSHGERSDPLTEILQVEELVLIIQDLHATMQDSKSVTLEWKHPVYGPVDSYEVQWALQYSDQLNIIAADSGRTWITIKDLTPAKTYIFRVASVLPRECGQENKFLSQEISFTLAPAMPGEVDRIASTIKSTSFDLKWRASGGRVDKYIVKISDYSTFGAEYQTKGPSPSLRIENLEVNTRYKLGIFAVRDNIKSEPRTENLKTKDVKVYWGCMTKAILTGGIAIAGVTAFAPFLGAVGFGAAGIGKGTMAASWMSSFGGTVASGGLFSTLQSLGVVGLGASAKAAIIASGMALGCIVEVI